MFTSLFYRGANDTSPTNQSIIPIGSTYVEKPTTSTGLFSTRFLGTSSNTIKRVGFDDVLYIIKQINGLSKRNYLLINTMSTSDQDVLIQNTVSFQIEESRINEILDDFRKDINQYVIVVYGRNCTDNTVDRKYHQLWKLGFRNIYVYYGGMFEWLLLQDVYGEDYFPVESTGNAKKDPLRYSPEMQFKLKNPR